MDLDYARKNFPDMRQKSTYAQMKFTLTDPVTTDPIEVADAILQVQTNVRDEDPTVVYTWSVSNGGLVLSGAVVNNVITSSALTVEETDVLPVGCHKAVLYITRADGVAKPHIIGGLQIIGRALLDE